MATEIERDERIVYVLWIAAGGVDGLSREPRRVNTVGFSRELVEAKRDSWCEKELEAKVVDFAKVIKDISKKLDPFEKLAILDLCTGQSSLEEIKKKLLASL